MKTIIDRIFGRGLMVCDIPTRDSEPEPRTYLEQLEAENRELKQRIAERRRLEELEAENQELKERTSDRRTRDAMLEAVEPGKLIALGRVWDGIGERLDGMVQELRDLETPFTVGNILTAEDVAEYMGMNRARAALTDFQQAVREAKGVIGATSTASDRRTADSRQDWSARFFDQARQVSRNGIARINQANREHAAPEAESQRRLMGHRTMDSVVPFTPQPRRPMSIREINETNRRSAARLTDQQRQMVDGDGDDWPPRAA